MSVREKGPVGFGAGVCGFSLGSCHCVSVISWESLHGSLLLPCDGWFSFLRSTFLECLLAWHFRKRYPCLPLYRGTYFLSTYLVVVIYRAKWLPPCSCICQRGSASACSAPGMLELGEGKASGDSSRASYRFIIISPQSSPNGQGKWIFSISYAPFPC